MYLLIVAATDHTGRTVTLLTAGLLAVALGLLGLTIWYWRFTSPRRRLVAANSRTLEPVQSSETSTIAPAPVAAPGLSGAPEPSVLVHVDIADVAAVEPTTTEPGPPATAWSAERPNSDVDSTCGLDGDEWALLSQAVFDCYIDENVVDHQ